MGTTALLADRTAGSTERERLMTLLTDDDGPAVVYLHGPGGVGKSALLADTLDRLAVTDVRIDGRHVEPTFAGVLQAIGADLDLDPADTTSIAGIAASFADLEVQVLAVDSVERLGVIDGWLRNDLLPALPAAVRTVLAGRDAPNLAWRASPCGAGPHAAPAPAVAALSPRELEVLAAVAEGLTNHQLAERLFISERTANRHLSNIFTKLGVHNRTAATRIAVEAGLAG